MTKYYFMAIQGIEKNSGNLNISSSVVCVRDVSLKQISERIAELKGLESAVITSIKDLSKQEYEMLKGK